MSYQNSRPQRNFRYGNNKSGYNKFRPNNNRGRSYGRGKPKGLHPDVYIAKAVEENQMESIYVGEETFDSFKIDEGVKKNIAYMRFTNPTKVQSLTIPAVLEGKDVLATANTGSGKTGAYLIPLITKCLNDNSQKCLIIVPTRELAMQIADEFAKFAFHTKLKSVVVMGGTSIRRQVYILERNPQFVIGTPGRLKDLAKRGSLHLNEFNNIVLDEVDRMLDMGFVNEIKELISRLGETKQSLFFSATMTREAEGIANTLLKNPIRINAEKQMSLKNIDQNMVRVTSPADKIDKLHDMLITEEFRKVLVFSRTKRGADKLSIELTQRGFSVDSIHGDKTQFLRSKIIMKFKKNDIKILIATDVVARGIDIKDITHVINYDEPDTYENYIHRIGRTGRVGKRGYAITFVG